MIVFIFTTYGQQGALIIFWRRVCVLVLILQYLLGHLIMSMLNLV